MTDSTPQIELSQQTLYEALVQLRLPGLYPAIRAGAVPTLVAWAALVAAAEQNSALAEQITSGTADERHEAAAAQLKVMLKTAAERLDGNGNKIIATILALAAGDNPTKLKERRETIAAKVGYSVHTLVRHKERPLLKSLAAILLDLYGHVLVAPARAATPEPPEIECPPATGQLDQRQPPRRGLLVSGVIAGVLGVALVGYELFGGASSRGYRAPLEASLYADNITQRTAHWNAAGTTAEPGDVVALEVYFMDQASPRSGLDAVHVRLNIGLDQDTLTTDHVIRATVSSLTSSPVTATTHIATAQPSRLTLVPESVTWKHNAGSEARPQWRTHHLNDATVTGAHGFVIDPDERPANSYAETVTFRVIASST